MTDDHPPPSDPRLGRQVALLRFLRASLVLVFAMGAVDIVLPAPWKSRVAGAMVVALIAIPAIRVLWLTVRWTGKGDRRYALAGLVLMAVMVSGLLVN